MPRSSLTGYAILISAALLIASFVRLLFHGLYWYFAKLMCMILVWAWFMKWALEWAQSLPTDDQRVWALVPLCFQVPLVLVSGYLLHGHVKDLIKPSPKVPNPPYFTKVRFGGAVLSLIALGIWLYGVNNPLSGGSGVLLLGVMCYCGLLGIYRIISGKTMF